MSRTLRLFALFGSGTVLLTFGVLVVNQTAQVVELADRVHPAFGQATLWGLVSTYVLLLGVPVVLFVRLPSPLVPPSVEKGPEFEAHLERLRRRLAGNPLLKGRSLKGRDEIEAALGVLGAHAEEVVRQSASHIFLATAVSQSGRLDGLMVLTAQSMMIWRVARVYSQRPNAREMLSLYTNVAGTAFVAGEIGDFDLSDQVEPVLAAAVGALGASIPGLQVAGAILTNCVLNGSANAFLTLRVGLIAKQHSEALVARPRAEVRRSAGLEATRLLGAIVSDGTRRLTGAIWNVSKGKAADVVKGISDYARGAGSRIADKLRTVRVSDDPTLG
ncbi:MAG: DUF697 domain-containing protein [Isosphaeraceae bacterium]